VPIWCTLLDGHCLANWVIGVLMESVSPRKSMTVPGVPETDRGFERGDNLSYNPVEGCLDGVSVGCLMTACPGQEHLEVAGEGGFDPGPPGGCSCAVSRPCGIVHADQSGDGEQTLAGQATTQLNRITAFFQFPPPALGVLSDIAVEATGGSDVGGEVRQRRMKVRSPQMHAVVPQKHTAAVRFISLTQEIAGLGGGDLHGSTEIREP
jgi:hypothetical protein